MNRGVSRGGRVLEALLDRILNGNKLAGFIIVCLLLAMLGIRLLHNGRAIQEKRRGSLYKYMRCDGSVPEKATHFSLCSLKALDNCPCDSAVDSLVSEAQLQHIINVFPYLQEDVRSFLYNGDGLDHGAHKKASFPLGDLHKLILTKAGGRIKAQLRGAKLEDRKYIANIMVTDFDKLKRKYRESITLALEAVLGAKIVNKIMASKQAILSVQFEERAEDSLRLRARYLTIMNPYWEIYVSPCEMGGMDSCSHMSYSGQMRYRLGDDESQVIRLQRFEMKHESSYIQSYQAQDIRHKEGEIEFGSSIAMRNSIALSDDLGFRKVGFT